MKWTSLLAGAAALVLCVSNAAAAARDGLQVRLSAPEPVLRGDVDVTVGVSITNTTREAVTLMRWELPSARPEAALFRITRDGEAVAYTGPLIKRGPPTREDLVRIEPGATITTEVELTAAYDLSRNGLYTIEYVGKGAAAEGALRSAAPLNLWLESRSERAASMERTFAVGPTGMSITTCVEPAAIFFDSTEATRWPSLSKSSGRSTRISRSSADRKSVV